MKKNDFIKNIKLNIKDIYNNIFDVFEITKEEFNTLILNIINSFQYNENLKKKEFSMNIFSIENLLELKSMLIKIGLTEEEIKKIIVKSPIILLYSDKLDNIYYLFKNKKYYGYTILDNKKYYTFLLNDNLNSNIISNNYIIEKMIDYYNIKKFEKEDFDNLESDFKLKNYYFKKKSKQKNY